MKKRVHYIDVYRIEHLLWYYRGSVRVNPDSVDPPYEFGAGKVYVYAGNGKEWTGQAVMITATRSPRYSSSMLIEVDRTLIDSGSAAEMWELFLNHARML